MTQCEICGVDIPEKPSRPRRYCSRSCWSEAQTRKAASTAATRPACGWCDRPAVVKGMCQRHYKRKNYGRSGVAGSPAAPTECTICGRSPVNARGWCGRHYASWQRHGDPLEADRRVAARKALDSTYIDSDGYVVLRGEGAEHRLKMRAKPGEVVHHVNGIKSDNDLGNLHILAGQSAHKRAHASLESCAFELVRAGVIVFDRTTGLYSLP